MTCIDSCGEMTWTWSKSPCFLCKYLLSSVDFLYGRKQGMPTYAILTCPRRMMAYVSRGLQLKIIYLSPMHIAERVIVGYSLPDNVELLLDEIQAAAGA